MRSGTINCTQVLLKFHEYYAPVLELSLSTTNPFTQTLLFIFLHHVYSESRGEDSCEDVSGTPSLVFFPVKPPDTLHGYEEDREGGL